MQNVAVFARACELSGSEKQIKWAEEIRKNCFAKAENHNIFTEADINEGAALLEAELSTAGFWIDQYSAHGNKSFDIYELLGAKRRNQIDDEIRQIGKATAKEMARIGAGAQEKIQSALKEAFKAGKLQKPPKGDVRATLALHKAVLEIARGL